MEQQVRIEKLKQIKSSIPYMTGIRIRYQGEIKELNAYKIPLQFLIYNKYNARIGSIVKTFENQNRSLNPEIESDIKIIEKFLWYSKEDRNKITLESIVKDGQKQWGIVTNDGKIIDGNRRAMILNDIYKNRQKYDVNVDNCEFFIAVILDKDADERENVKLETTYQMGEDKKLDYNPIEKYLRCKDLKEKYSYDISDIAEMMGENKSQIEEWLEIMEVMDSYLGYLGYEGIYTRLEKREGQFVDLTNYLSRYDKKNKSAKVEWDYDDSDVNDLKMVCFDYIRAQYEGKDFRLIAKPSDKESFFCKEKVWDQFIDEHMKIKDKVDEKTVSEYLKDRAEGDPIKALEKRDDEWKIQVAYEFKRNYGQANHLLEDIVHANEPIDLLNRIRNILNNLNTQSDPFYSQEVAEMLHDVEKITYRYRKLIEEKIK